MKSINKNKIFYNKELDKWECGSCGATYNSQEIERVFDYTFTPTLNNMLENKDNICFIPCHCMDCGIKWGNFEL